MKKIFTLLLALILTHWLHAQSTSLNLDFSDPAHANQFTFIEDTGGEVVKSVTNGEMKLVLNKKEWHFFQLYINPFDFINNPYVSFRVKADQATPVRMWMKQADGAELTIYESTIQPGSDYQTVAFTVNNLAPLTTHIQEMGIDLGGYQLPPAIFSGTVYFDEFKLGEAAKPGTSLNLDFSDPAHADRLNYIFDTGGELTKSVDGGELKLVLNKKEWHFFQVWVSPFDFIKNPYLRFRIKTDQNTPVRIWMNQLGGGAEKEIFNQTISAGTEYQTIQIDVENVAPLSGYIQELNIDFGGYQLPPAAFAATIYLDELVLGEEAKPATEVFGTSYQEDFSAPLYAGWLNGDGYGLSREGDALRININRTTPITDAQIGKLPSLGFEGKVLDISASPYVNLNIKGNDPFVLSVIAVDNSNRKKEHTIRIVPTGDYQTVSFNLASIPGLDLSKIEKIYFDFNRQGFAFFSTVWIDDISIGDEATNLAVMDAIADKKFYKNSGAKEILLTNIQNAASINVTSIPSYLENVSVSAITNGTAKLFFKPKMDQTGDETLSLTLEGASGYANNVYNFKLTIENNLPPTIDSLASVQTEIGKPLRVRLTGLSDGNSTVEQKLSYMVNSTNANVASGAIKFVRWIPTGALEPTLEINSKVAGTATVSLTIKDNGDGNNSTVVSFDVHAFKELNSAPTIDPVQPVEVYEDAGPSSITLTGINDGDSENQTLNFTIINSNPAIVNNVSVDYDGGNTAILNYLPVADTTGTSAITLMVTDEGGNEVNDGNDSTTISFNITVLKRPITGYTATLDKSIEGYNSNDKYEITEVDSAGFKALVFKATDKFYWDGVNMNLPEELDLTEHPYLTMEVFPLEQNTLHWLWFWDASGNRNELNNLSKVQTAIAGQWNKLVFDFSGENDWVSNATNAPINTRRITRILFDMHNAAFAWPPPPNYTGTFIVRNIRIGSQADFQVTPMATIDPVPNQVNFSNKNSIKIKLKGISDGNGGTQGVTLDLTNSNSSVVKRPTISAVDSNGEAILKYNAGAQGTSTITITASANGAMPKEMSFDISILTDSASKASVVTIDLNTKHQTMHGFGTFSFGASSTNTHAYTELMGASAHRTGLIGAQFEPVNDNDDPNVLNMEGFNYGAFDWNHLRTLRENGVRSFILTSWSPPAWMKTNLSLDHYAAGYTLNTHGTTNRLDFAMYDEYAESMVAVVKAFKLKAGIDLLGIGLQNEPAFHEPYPSAILGPNEFVDLIKVVGKRFKKEGIKTKLYMPEHVSMFVADINQYLAAVKADPEADEYTDVLAIHGYGSDGITPGQPKFEEWEAYRANSAEGDHPKEVWMTETHKDYTTWEDALSMGGAIYGALEYGDVSLWTQWAFEGPFIQKGKATSMLYVMANFAKYIRPGDVRVNTTSSHPDILATTFVDEESGNTNMVLINKGDVPLSVKIESAGSTSFWMMVNTTENRDLERIYALKNEVFLLPAKSVTTLVGESAAMEAVASTAKKDSTDNVSDDDGTKHHIEIYPNPSNGVFYLGNDSGAEKIEIADFNGYVRYKTSLKQGENSISVNTLPPGVYIISITGKHGNRKERIIIR